MSLRRHQIVIIFFAISIFLITFASSFIFQRIDQRKPPEQVPTQNQVIKIFFSNALEDPETLYCEQTHFVYREVFRLSDGTKSELGELLYLAIAELLKGPVGAEKEEGFFTSINPDTKVNGIVLGEGVARIDFDENLNEGAAGSCKVQAIRSQITETLKQFPEVKEVVISVNGSSEGILEP
ncbi:MAG: hypothetical protein A3B91_04345 [Candidatus Yanofskybacteria bacterium RIFCSPHIGHO2_02_FULL_41_29]|uniref:GerMN domain-containing protein n=1 Tax=Candidatus Yanofskybacteria bacterium RIFCSPHIGHO2_01_FULL_41_53 TaxID=1802663 RepID=A0A1F8EK87_9BACT|nr:MAG: hypothetical protein A2650_03605 [Candidatus Yanofskybacteria bacterium RIFCSPHIGHO2_01_FULL_41_53]OGN11753.1 MAG: hypothetical protein A3B91_04345 [Candidatus Yanofskybacteria bacterium RIFCSPHIGHO2_02_FULL_41_29]OGN17516.1 MAG: hypothetical protein A3F48_01900 [Candidatus Yanofskybacteria bacterium RIFCSPHIGHO2_12_FULL_41_9]OGN22907.1 MAG: hypothetical protein A2916_00800 [Candidatus Yanofskybacteria bacterium RIFCSPLOWO2_01_FULL_41_67]OGN30289.1 MAG: hypothetical protein A3H54_05200 